MTTSRAVRAAKAKEKPKPAATQAQPEEEASAAIYDPALVVPSAAPVPTEIDPLEVPSGAEDEEPDDSGAPDPGNEPLPKEYVVLDGPASFGPVVIGGRRTAALRNKLYYVPQVEERADILGSGFFRAATKNDLARSEAPSAGPSGAVTRDLLPPGALKKE